MSTQSRRWALKSGAILCNYSCTGIVLATIRNSFRLFTWILCAIPKRLQIAEVQSRSRVFLNCRNGPDAIARHDGCSGNCLIQQKSASSCLTASSRSWEWHGMATFCPSATGTLFSVIFQDCSCPLTMCPDILKRLRQGDIRNVVYRDTDCIIISQQDCIIPMRITMIMTIHSILGWTHPHSYSAQGDLLLSAAERVPYSSSALLAFRLHLSSCVKGSCR